MFIFWSTWVVAKRALTKYEHSLLQKFGKQVKRRRERLQWSQSRLAKESSLEGSAVNLRKVQSIEAGNTNITFATANRIAEVLGMKFAWSLSRKSQSEAVDEMRPMFLDLEELVKSGNTAAIEHVATTIQFALTQHRNS